MQLSRWLSLSALCLLMACATQTTISTLQESSGQQIIIPPNLDTPQQSRSIIDEVTGSTTPNVEPTKIRWDKWGVPHIYARSNDELFYAFGWAQMHSHANTILDLYAKSRGQAAEYWGEQYLQKDMMIKTMGFDKLAQEWYDKQTPEFKIYIDQFVRGMNDYIAKHPEAVSDQNKVVLPVRVTDIPSQTIYCTFAVFMGREAFGESQRWESVGSNAYAIAPSRSASGHAMLVQNPHLPWFGEFLFYEGHFNTPDVHGYGATLVGLPTLGIAFNEHLGWTHTVNTIDNADLYEITLKDNGYIVDGAVRPLTRERMSIKVKGDDGKVVVKDMFRYISPDHGPILKQDGDKAVALKMPGYDHPYGINQWWEMLKAKNLSEFKDAVDELQMPYFNIIYADDSGEIFYMFNGLVPKRKVGDWDHWSGIIDGSASENLWTDVHSFDELPMTENPASGYVQNANDPPWTSTFPMALDPKDYPPYMAPVRMSFRPQRAVRMIDEDASITFDELIEYKMSTHIEMADRLLDDLNAAVDQHGTDLSREAMAVLNSWDRQADADSKGMGLFYAWAHTLGPWHNIYATPWSKDSPRATPDGLADPKAAVMALDAVAQKYKDAGYPMDLPWGMQYRIRYGGKDLPANGADGSVGIFRVAWSNGLEDDGRYYVSGGDSWQSIIEFGPRIKAKVTMSYGNSTQQGSPNFGDQLELFAKKEMRECTFYKEDVIKATVMTEVLTDDGFVSTNY